jgi:hypothetical protein
VVSIWRSWNFQRLYILVQFGFENDYYHEHYRLSLHIPSVLPLYKLILLCKSVGCPNNFLLFGMEVINYLVFDEVVFFLHGVSSEFSYS